MVIQFAVEMRENKHGENKMVSLLFSLFFFLQNRSLRSQLECCEEKFKRMAARVKTRSSAVTASTESLWSQQSSFISQRSNSGASISEHFRGGCSQRSLFLQCFSFDVSDLVLARGNNGLMSGSGNQFILKKIKAEAVGVARVPHLI